MQAMVQARQFKDAADAPTKATHANLLIGWHQDHARYGYALQMVQKQLEELGRGASDTKQDLHRAQDLQIELLGHLQWDVWQHHLQRWTWLGRPVDGAPPY